jgi:hypothetical protein
VREGVTLAAKAIDGGAAPGTLERFVATSQRVAAEAAAQPSGAGRVS